MPEAENAPAAPAAPGAPGAPAAPGAPGALAALAGKPVVLLLSGGLDSATCLALAASAGARVLALTIDYNQRHRRELTAAADLAALYGVERHIILPLDLRGFGGSALTDDIDVPKGGPEAAVAPGIPVTYVPARNTIFLSVALGWAEAMGSADLLIGINALDYSGYPDCRPEFVAAFEAMANLATRAGVEGSARCRVHTPLLHLSKAGIVRAATAAGLDMGRTWSCYDPTDDGRHCGECDSCRLRRKGFLEAGVADPTGYR
ncbi:MAG: 7-cyano-7-deazaguanine synthase QueC [Sandarakinorhabdus sp.]|nr:7-cyano-7-deazaguanine synthase QueC [Sandarakinorhabdus sp.]